MPQQPPQRPPGPPRPPIRQMIRGIGRGSKPDDVSRLSNMRTMKTDAQTVTQGGATIPAGVDSGIFFSANFGTRTIEYRNSIGTTPKTITWGNIVTAGIEVCNDSGNDVGIAFGGAVAQVPSDSDTPASTCDVKTGEKRSFNIHTNMASIIASGASSAVRVTILLP